MRFGCILHHIIRCALIVDPRLGQFYLGKVDLDYAYIRIWVRVEDTPSVAFLLPKKRPEDNQLVGSQFPLPMVFMDSEPYFCVATETVADLMNISMESCQTAPPNAVEKSAATRAPSECAPPRQ